MVANHFAFWGVAHFCVLFTHLYEKVANHFLSAWNGREPFRPFRSVDEMVAVGVGPFRPVDEMVAAGVGPFRSVDEMVAVSVGPLRPGGDMAPVSVTTRWCNACELCTWVAKWRRDGATP